MYVRNRTVATRRRGLGWAVNPPPAGVTPEQACRDKGMYWYNGACYSNPQNGQAVVTVTPPSPGGCTIDPATGGRVCTAPSPGGAVTTQQTGYTAYGSAQNSGGTYVPPATPAVTPATLLDSLPTALKESTWISGVPNWVVLLGGGAAAYAFSKRRY